MNWSIQLGDVTKAVADWGITGLVFRTISQRPDEAVFTVPVARMDDDPIFAEGSLLKFYRGDSLWFAGHVRPVSCSHRGGVEAQIYQVISPWFWLENNDYQAVWSYYVSVGGGPYTLVNGNSTHVLVNLGANGALINTKTMIERVLDFAISRGALLSKGTIDIPSVYLRVMDIRDQACGEVIRTQLRPHPDAVVYLDYSVWPPRVNIRPASALTAASLARGTFQDLEITAQSDLMRPAVVVRYEKTAVIDGVESRIMEIDRAPEGATGIEEDALNYTINLRGMQAQNAQATLECEALPTTDEDWLTWLKARIPWLNNAQLQNLAFVAGTHPTRTGALGLANELVKGQIPAWVMAGGAAARNEEENLRARITFDWYTADGLTKVSTVEDEEIVQQFQATDAVTGTYYALTNFTPADPQPVGLAAHELAVRSVLHFAGSLAIVEQECSGLVRLGNTLNLTGYRQAAWATMAEMVQSVTEDIFHGTTSVQFGPAGQLYIPDLVNLMLK